MRFLIACSIALFAGLVNEGAGASFKTVSELAEWINSLGETTEFPSNIASDLDVLSSQYRMAEVEEINAADGRYHAVLSFRDHKGGRDLIFATRYQAQGDSESFYCKTDSEGKPVKAFFQRGKHDAEGKPIRGSAVVTPLAADSRELRKRLKAELDFWLKGKGRKAKPATKP